jgi:hypothetical protein
MRFDPADAIFFLPFVILAALGMLLPKPFRHIWGVAAMWSPLVIIQVQSERWWLAVILILVALAILKSIWNDE